MCVRYAAYQIKEVLDFLEITDCDELDSFKDNYNASPGQYLPIVTSGSPHKVSIFKWGLIPPWYKTGITASNMFNVDATQIARRPVLRNLLSSQRCLILTSGYYEWKKDQNKQIPHRVKVKDEKFTLLAGLYEASTDRRTGERMDSFTIITIPARPDLEHLYSSMPLILVGDHSKKWLDAGSSPELINEILVHTPVHQAEVFQVSDTLTDSRNNLPGLILKI